MAEAIRLKARLHLHDFALCMAPPEYNFNWHHAVLYRWLNEFAEGKRKRVIIQAPPGHGKSEAVSRNLPAYLLGRDPDARIITSSYTQPLSSEMNRDVQKIIDSERYRRVFPRTRLGSVGDRFTVAARRNMSIFDVAGRRGYYKCAGVGVGITGRRFDYGIIDDPVKDRDDANSAAHRESVWRWFTGAFYTRQAKNAGILITLTRWHVDDLVGRLLKRMEDGGERWDVLTLPALAGDERHPDDIRQAGEPLWPWFKSLRELEAVRELEPRDFASLYQQNPRAEGGTEWPESYFGPGIWFEDWPSDLTIRTIALDPSKGKSSKFGDYSAIVRLGRSADGTLWCEADLRRRTVEQIVEDSIEHQREFNADLFAVETNQFQELLAAQIAAVSKARGMMLPVKEIDNGVNKLVRVRRLGPYLARGAIRFKGGSPGTKLLVKQLQDFPLADHDDGPDALEMALRTMIDLWNGRMAKARPTRVRA